MSIVAEVLNTASEAEMLSLPKKMSEISQHVAFLRSEVKGLMESKYLNLISRNGDPGLVGKAAEVSSNIVELQARLDQQTNTESANVAKELHTLTEALLEARIMCDLTQKLLEVDQAFESAFTSRSAENYFQAAILIEKVENLLSTFKSDLEFSSIYEALCNKARFNTSLLSGEALKMWKSEVSWVVHQLDSQRKTSTLKVHSSRERLENIIKALNAFELCEPQIYYFSQSLMSNVLIPCVDHRVDVRVQSKSEHVLLTVVTLPDERPTLAEVLDSLTRVFEFLHSHMDLVIDESKNFMAELGYHLADKLLSHLVGDTLSDAIPTRRQDLPMYEGFVLRIIEFNALLQKMKFLPDDSRQLENFCCNVEEQFLNKTIERYCARAREISMKNLHDMSPIIDTKTDSQSDSEAFDATSLRRESVIQLTELPMDFGQFPPCHLSKNVQELMDLVREILDNCIAGDHPLPGTPLKLFCTARDCVNLYVELTPVIHAKLLESLPQQAALFHNNCFYIAHEFITLNEPYRAKYNEQVLRAMGTFVDMVHYVRSQGLKVLEYQVSKNNDVILDIVSRSGLSNLAEVDVPPLLEKSLRQCLHQLSFLETMWLTVLPMQVYNKIMGQLCNSFLDEIIGKVCLTKDIKEATATHLVRLFINVQECLPNLFEEPKEVHRLVKKWSKFAELIHVLNGSLMDIGDRWADGKGPLAIEFTAEQVRQLIKALFQVSNRRAAVLARIK